MTMWFYQYSGLSIRSDLEIDEWQPYATAAQQAQVTIRLCEAASLPDVENSPISADSYRFHVADAGDYWVRAGCEILVAPAGHALAAEARLFLLGTAWGALCYQRGILSLHASAVQLDAGVVAFCGESGAGKSSTTAFLLRHGARFIADDLCRFECAELGSARVYPSVPRLKLWSESVGQLDLGAGIVQRDHFRHDKYHIAVEAQRQPQPQPLAAICLLQWGESLALTRLQGRQALSHLVAAASYRAYLLEPMGLLATHWQQCLQLAQCVPVFQLQRRRNWSDMEPAMHLLMQQMQKPN